MRPFAYATLLVALAGCSLPYQGTSFAALPKPAHLAEGGEGHKNDQTVEPKGEIRAENGATRGYAGDKENAFPDVPSSHWAYEVQGGASKRTGTVFPSTAQPAAEPVASTALVGSLPGVDPDAKPGTNPEGPGASGETSPNVTPPTTMP